MNSLQGVNMSRLGQVSPGLGLGSTQAAQASSQTNMPAYSAQSPDGSLVGGSPNTMQTVQMLYSIMSLISMVMQAVLSTLKNSASANGNGANSNGASGDSGNMPSTGGSGGYAPSPSSGSSGSNGSSSDGSGSDGSGSGGSGSGGSGADAAPGGAPGSANAAVNWALAHKGQGDQCAINAHPGEWCADFASTAYEKTGGSSWGHQSAVQGIKDWGVAHNKFSKTPTVGSAVIYQGPGISHTGLVSKVYADGSIDTVEGNSGSAAGGEVATHHYTLAQQRQQSVQGFVSQ